MNIRRIRTSVTAALVSAVSVSLVVSGCAKVDTVSPADARKEPAPQAAGKGGGTDCGEKKCVALTFDAGPSQNTPKLLNLLKRERVPATFFLLGKKHIDRYPELVRRIAHEGHEVANHTWSHGILTDLSDDDIREEIGRPQREIKKLTGAEPTLMRPPQGRTDEDVSEIAKGLGVSQVLWSVTAKDYQTTDSKLIKKRVLEQTERDGIILLHDIYKGTVPAVPGILKALKKEGYTFVTVPELLAPAKPIPGTIYRP